jgi:hypothetical protein
MYVAENCKEQIGLHQHDRENLIDVMTIVEQGEVKVADTKSTLLLEPLRGVPNPNFLMEFFPHDCVTQSFGDLRGRDSHNNLLRHKSRIGVKCISAPRA